MGQSPYGCETLSLYKAEKLIRRGQAVYMDAEKATLRFLSSEMIGKVNSSFGLGTRQISDWNGEGLPTHPLAAKRESRYDAVRKAREALAVGCHSQTEWEEILNRFGNRCVRCSIRAQDTYFGKLTKDHIVPLASGGTDFASNLQPLCRRCNSWKGNREIDFRRKYISAGIVTHGQQAN